MATGTSRLFQLVGPQGLRERRMYKSPTLSDQKAAAEHKAAKKKMQKENTDE